MIKRICKWWVHWRHQLPGYHAGYCAGYRAGNRKGLGVEAVHDYSKPQAPGVITATPVVANSATTEHPPITTGIWDYGAWADMRRDESDDEVRDMRQRDERQYVNNDYPTGNRPT